MRVGTRRQTWRLKGRFAEDQLRLHHGGVQRDGGECGAEVGRGEEVEVCVYEWVVGGEGLRKGDVDYGGAEED